MAIGIHVAKFAWVDEDSDTATPNKRRIAVDGSNSNTTGNPTLEDYLVAEAADNYLPSVITDAMVVTYNVTDMNGA